MVTSVKFMFVNLTFWRVAAVSSRVLENLSAVSLDKDQPIRKDLRESLSCCAR